MKFSVFLPTRNRAEWVPRCVASVLAQTYADLELVILDNSDEPYPPGVIPDDPRIVYRWQLCRGVAHASDEAVRICSGDVVVPLGDDDTLPLDCLERSAASLGDALWLNGRTEIVDPAGTVIAHRGGDIESVERTLGGEYWLGGAVHWRRELTERSSYAETFEGAADFALYLRFIRTAPPVLVPEIMYLYTDWPGTDSRVHAAQQYAQSQRIREEVVYAPALDG